MRRPAPPSLRLAAHAGRNRAPVSVFEMTQGPPEARFVRADVARMIVPSIISALLLASWFFSGGQQSQRHG